MIDDQLGEHSQLSPPCLLHEATEIGHRAEVGIDRAVVRNIVAVVAARRGIERQQPKRGDAEILQVVEFFGQPCEMSATTSIARPSREAAEQQGGILLLIDAQTDAAPLEDVPFARD
jgi:hypothetical protein